MTVPLEAIRDALSGRHAWVVGGAVRDGLLDRPLADLDLLVEGDARDAARSIARATGAAPFRLSDAFGSWRVAARDWNVDLIELTGGLDADLAARDFTVNAMAQPLAGGPLVDPHLGRADLDAGLIRMVSADALHADPLRTLRAVRLAVELGFAIHPETADAVRAHAPALRGVAAERIFAELRRVVAGPTPLAGLRLMDELGVTAAVLPELAEMRGVEQNVFHHRDVYEHTLEVVAAVVELEADPAAAGLAPAHAERAAQLLAEPFANELTRGGALRFAALLHDVAKPRTRGLRGDGRVTFIGHDEQGAEVAEQMMRRLRASEKLAAYVALLTRHHLSIGFLVHERPLSRRAAWRFLRATWPYSADVVALTVADRLATRGRNAEAAIEAHLEVANDMLTHVWDYEPGPPVVRGDELAEELGREPGPWLTGVLARLEEDRYAGEISSREDAIEQARRLVAQAR